jgi:hypothetical protein
MLMEKIAGDGPCAQSRLAGPEPCERRGVDRSFIPVQVRPWESGGAYDQDGVNGPVPGPCYDILKGKRFACMIVLLGRFDFDASDRCEPGRRKVALVTIFAC